MTTFKLPLAVTVTLMVIFLGCDTKAEFDKKTQELGLDMASKALEVVCWYEHHKHFPKPVSSDLKTACQYHGYSYRSQILKHTGFDKQPHRMTETFAGWVQESPERFNLSSEYQTNCDKFLEDVDLKATDDEGDALNDAAHAEEYPLKGYAYCMIHTLRQRFGDAAIDAIKNEMTHSKKEWIQAIIDRENEHRSLHGVDPVELNDEITQSAQKSAEKMAQACKLESSRRVDRIYKGKQCGENLMAFLTPRNDNLTAAYDAANQWYSGIRNYPFDTGFNGEDSLLFQQFGRFSQVVWKDTKLVGYGYAYNEECRAKGGMTGYLVGRYYPQGNILSAKAFQENVFPPKKAEKAAE